MWPHVVGAKHVLNMQIPPTTATKISSLSNNTIN